MARKCIRSGRGKAGLVSAHDQGIRNNLIKNGKASRYRKYFTIEEAIALAFGSREDRERVLHGSEKSVS